MLDNQSSLVIELGCKIIHYMEAEELHGDVGCVHARAITADVNRWAGGGKGPCNLSETAPRTR